MASTQLPDPYLAASPETLRAEAADWVDANYMHGELGYCDPGDATWSYHPHYDVSKLLHLLPDQWLAWFRDEQTYASEAGREGYYDWMLDRPITDAIVVLECDGKGYIWDGWHRSGATFTKGMSTIRAIVGIAQN